MTENYTWYDEQELLPALTMSEVKTQLDYY